MGIIQWICKGICGLGPGGEIKGELERCWSGVGLRVR